MTEAPAPAPVSKRRGLLVRLVAAPLVLGGSCAVLFWHDRSGSSAPTDVVLALLAAGAAYEVAVMASKAEARADLRVAVLFSALLAGLGLAAPHDAGLRGALRALALSSAVLAAFLAHMRRAREGDLQRLLSTLFPVVYVGFLLGLLREVGDGPDGAKRMVLVVVAAKASDIGGWLVGKPFGRHKMIPSVSPGKSWEGTAGGLALSAGAAAGLSCLLGPLPPLAWGPPDAALLGLVLGVASILAGLTQSALKRRCGVKDSSALLPEMGGVLDQVDSLLLAAPVAWAWCLLLR